ncbi:MAG: hypothetical protein PHT41_03255 [Candidatus Omnitrophica bacterium]|nr:hypothetical protein [Candidatus Omnitrophota bacterium]
MKKQLIFIIGAALALTFIFALILFSFYQTGRLQKEMESLTTSKPEEYKATITPSSPERPRIVPKSAQDYGLTEIKPGDEPKTQSDWNRSIAEKMERIKSQMPAEEWNKIQEEKVGKREPAKLKEDITRLEEAFKKCEEILKKNPEDKAAQKRLGRLMRLRSIAKELPDK